MILEVKKGSHRFRLSWPRLVFRKRMSYTVTFLPSCRYDIGADQVDWNKLFGVGFFPHHHRNSYRFGWRYNIDTGLIEIGAYWYYEGNPHSERIFLVKINKPVKFTLCEDWGRINWAINGTPTFSIWGKWPLIGYKLGAYFGGNQSAPHEMKIKISKNA